MDNNNEVINTYPLDALKPHPRNTEFFDDADDEAFQNLKDSIAEVGLLTPLRVSKNYTIISGHQRYRACKELGVEYVPCIVDDGLTDENEMLMQLIVSNFGRMKNDPAKQGKMIEEYEKLMGVKHGGSRASGNNFRLNQDEVAKQFGITARSMRDYKRFAHMPEEIQEYVKTGKLKMTGAVKVLSALSPDDQLKVLSSFPDALKRITQAELEERVASMYKASQEAEAQAKAELAVKEAEIKKNLQEAQSTRQAAEVEASIKAAQLADLDKKIKAAEEKLSDKQAELAEVQAQIKDTEYEEPVEPEVIYPDDYDKIKTGYDEIKNDLRNKEVEIFNLKKQLDDAKAQVAKKSEPVINMPPRAAAPIQMDNENRGILHRDKIQQCFADVKFYIDNVIADPDILNKELPLECRKPFSDSLVMMITRLTTVARNMEV